MRLEHILKEDLLTEMPYAPIDNEGKTTELKMSTENFDHFYSDNTIAEEWKLVKQEGDKVVYINNDHTLAFVGKVGTNNQGKHGVNVIVSLEFKFPQYISKTNPSMTLKGALQVDLAIVLNRSLARGSNATFLYASLVQMGITIISDNTQYRGGKELWKSLARNQHGNGYEINIIDDGKPMMDQATGKPFVYDGSNLPDDELWSARKLPMTMPSGLTAAGIEDWKARQNHHLPDKTVTLFIMRKN